jgi:serine/threonine protein kinase/Flp pilus assembly protein TadD
MIPDPQQAKAIFLQAMEQHTPDQWPAFLDQACSGQPELRERVKLLLDAHRETGTMAQPSGAEGPSPHEGNAMAERPSMIIGPYKLLELIGEGGMGAVWMAQQTEPVKRLVAVKLIKAGMDSKQVIARFEAERQALALMDHPNIARVLDGGTTQGEPGGVSPGRPYFVMDLVKGIPITKYCDEHHFTPRQRLELFLPVCQAVQHAHQKGIIHRDLKPSNVLVALYDGRPVPKVIDFGVAKAAGQSLTDKTLVTGFGSIVGTLEYMSPEQAEVNNQDIDTRSDIYALGVLLYELLAGSTPLTKKRVKEAALLEVLRVIREEEPPKPSTRLSSTDELPSVAAQRQTEPAKLTKLIRGELDWIVMKALEKNRNRRYETANGFAIDIQRYLADEPVLACPPTVGYRLRKFARRHKAGLAVAATVLFLLVLLGGVIGWAVRGREARQAKAAGQVESIFAEVNRFEHEQKWPEALAAARRAEAVVSGSEAEAAIEKLVRARLTDLEFIDRLEQIRTERSMWVEGRLDNAGAARAYAKAFRDYGVDVEELAVEAAIDRLKARPALAIALAAALDNWFAVRFAMSETDAAGWGRFVAVARGIDPHPLRDRLRSCWGQPITPQLQDELRRIAESIDLRAQLPGTLLSLALTFTWHEDYAAAVRLLRDAQSVYPGDYWLNYYLGYSLNQQRDNEGASRFCAAAVAIRPNSTAARTNLGIVLRNLRRPDEAIAALGKAVELDPKNARAYVHLGGALRSRKKLPEAAEAYRKAIELDPEYSPSYYELGNILYAQKKTDEGAHALRLGLEHDADLQRFLAQDSNPTETEKTRRFVIYNAPRFLLAGDTDSYRRLCNRMLTAFVCTEDPSTAYTVARTCALAPDTVPDATRLVQLAETAVRAQAVPHHLHTLGLAYYRAGKFDEAIVYLQKSIAGNWIANAANWLVLAMAHQSLNRTDEARKWYDQAVKWIDNPGADPLDSLHSLDAMACLLLRREAETRLGLPPQTPSEGKKLPGEHK